MNEIGQQALLQGSLLRSAAAEEARREYEEFKAELTEELAAKSKESAALQVRVGELEGICKRKAGQGRAALDLKSREAAELKEELEALKTKTKTELNAQSKAAAARQARISELEANWLLQAKTISTLEAEKTNTSEELEAKAMLAAALQVRVSEQEANEAAALHARMSELEANKHLHETISSLETEKTKAAEELESKSKEAAALQARVSELQANKLLQAEAISSLETEKANAAEELDAKSREAAALQARVSKLEANTHLQAETISSRDVKTQEHADKLSSMAGATLLCIQLASPMECLGHGLKHGNTPFCHFAESFLIVCGTGQRISVRISKHMLMHMSAHMSCTL